MKPLLSTLLAVAIILTALMPVSGVEIIHPMKFEGNGIPVNVTEDFVEARGARIAVVKGQSGNSSPVISISGPRIEEINETTDGRRVMSRDYCYSEDEFLFGIYRIIEYRDVNNNSRFDGTSDGYNYHLLGKDIPVGGFTMNTTWRISHHEESDGHTTSLVYTFAKRGPVQDLRWNRYSGKMEEYKGGRAAENIRLSFVMNISETHTHEKIETKTVPEGTEEYTDVEGHNLELSSAVSCSIDRWNWAFPDSKLMIQAFLGVYHRGTGREYLINITTSSPRFMEVNGTTEMERSMPIYGHMQRITIGGEYRAGLGAERYCLEDGKNSTYPDLMTGSGTEIWQLEGMKGFYGVRGIMCGHNNSTVISMLFNGTYFIPSDFRRTDATPPWLVAGMMVEAGTIALVAVVASYSRYRRR